MKYWLFSLSVSFWCIVSLSGNEAERKAIQKAINRVSKSVTIYTEKRDCISCHHQSLPVMAMAHAKVSGLAVSKGAISAQTHYTQDYFESRLKLMHSGNGVIGGPYTAGYALVQMAEAKVKSDDTIQALAAYLLKTQKPDGSWRIRTHRPPLEDSHFTATALAIRGLKHYSKDQVKAIQSAVSWLRETKPASTEDHVFQILGLHWAGEDLSQAAKALLALQRMDSGWSQLPEMKSDAYATAQALYALKITSSLKADSIQLQSAKQWLLQNQKPDGSWHVKSRSRPIQNYFESGFPHDKDQFISISATCWAIMAFGDVNY